MENLICAHSQHWRHYLVDLLQQHGYGPSRTVTSLEQVRKALEQALPGLLVVVHEPPDVNALMLPTVIGKGYAIPTILAAPAFVRSLADEAVVAGYAAFLVVPSAAGAIHGAVAAARQRVDLLAPLQHKMAELERKLDERKVIERAKGLLMEQERLSEEQAFKKMRSLAMARRIGMAALAEEMIAATVRIR